MLLPSRAAPGSGANEGPGEAVGRRAGPKSGAATITRAPERQAFRKPENIPTRCEVRHGARFDEICVVRCGQCRERKQVQYVVRHYEQLGGVGDELFKWRHEALVDCASFFPDGAVPRRLKGGAPGREACLDVFRPAQFDPRLPARAKHECGVPRLTETLEAAHGSRIERSVLDEFDKRSACGERGEDVADSDWSDLSAHLRAGAGQPLLEPSYVRAGTSPRGILVAMAVAVSARWFTAAALTVGVMDVAGAATSFLWQGLLLNIVRPPPVLTFAAGSILAYRYIVEEKQRAVLRRSFEADFPPKLVERIVQNPALVTSTGEEKELTILFSDIRGFTGRSRTMSAEQVQRFLNTYFDAMVGAVFRHDGTVDRFIGDGLMAFYGHPDSA